MMPVEIKLAMTLLSICFIAWTVLLMTEGKSRLELGSAWICGLTFCGMVICLLTAMWRHL